MPETESNEEYGVLAAQIVGAHGVGGNVRLRLIGAEPETAARSIQAAKVVRAVRSSDGAARLLTLRSLRQQMQPKGAWLARFFEVTDRASAQDLYGYDVFIRETSRPALPDGEYYVDELLGFAVETDAGRPLGLLTDVLNSPAHDVYETDKGALIPAVSEYLVQIDREGRRIIVRDVAGLLGES